MPPAVGLLVWFIFVLVLLRYDLAEATPSPALWVPLIWMFIIGSRLPSQWLGQAPTAAGTAFEEGSALDRAVYLLLIALALGILAPRHLNWREVFARNSALTMFLLLGLASVTWSDFPFITFQ